MMGAMMGAEQLDAPPVFVLNNNLIEVYFTFHKIYPFKVYILVLFGIFRYIWYVHIYIVYLVAIYIYYIFVYILYICIYILYIWLQSSTLLS